MLGECYSDKYKLVDGACFQWDGKDSQAIRGRGCCDGGDSRIGPQDVCGARCASDAYRIAIHVVNVFRIDINLHVVVECG